MSTLEDLIIRVGSDVGDAEKGLGGLQSLANNTLAKVTAAGAAGGAALEAFARSQAESNAQTRQLASSLGLSEDAMRGLAIETANGGFPLAEVLDLMEKGKQLGITGGDSLKEYAEFWDMVGDATGENAVELGRAGVALATMGIEAEDQAEALAALGFIQEHSTQTTSDFLGVLGRLGPDLAAAGLDINDTAALLVILEQEMGMTGRAARTALNEAMRESDGTFSGLIDTLGITETTLDGYLSKVEESDGILARNAAIVDETFTPLQKVQNATQELMYEYGSLAEAAGMLAMPLMALGPAVGAVKWVAETAKLVAHKVAMVATSTATKVWAGVQWLLNTALFASPITWIVAGILLLVGAIILIATKTDWFQKAWAWAWGGIKDVALAVGRWFRDVLWEQWIKGAFEAIVGFAVKQWQILTSLPGKLGDAFKAVANFLTAPFRAAFNAISGMWNNSIGKLSWTIPGWVPLIGGKSISAPKLPTIPAFHSGGVKDGEGLALLRDDEGVFTAEQMRHLAPAGSGGGRLTLASDGSRLMDLLLEILREAIRIEGGDPVEVLAPGRA